ncbi:MAG: hypothetical protein JW806_03520 [Sedimentisphaerales bacterium]|nr:hypothetical protein [Sedimentisphaerales bacterium]
MNTTKCKKRIELGDWQTPLDLAKKACLLLKDTDIYPASIIEPTCGKGNFLSAAIEIFPSAKQCFGLDISDKHITETIKKIESFKKPITSTIIHADFFSFDWPKQIKSMPDPVLVIGNPPWVTNSGIGSLEGKNLPKKSNFQNMKGMDAITGKSNFDISEWIIINMLEQLKTRQTCIAMLCKTAVARKILLYGWKNHISLGQCLIFKIDSQQHFNVAVDACFLVITLGQKNQNFQCKVYEELNYDSPKHLAVFESNRLIPDLALYEKWKHLRADKSNVFKWRSGIKHDCVKVMELRKEGNIFTNGLGEKFELENDYIFPMLKSSDLANGQIKVINRYMLVTQHFVGEQTHLIKQNAPKTWGYLQKHASLLDQRTSIIYKNNPRFSIFGVGDYTFTDWKIAISGFYKNMRFRLIGPYESKPVVLDDTCYFLSCKSKEEAEAIHGLLSSEPAKEFFSAYIWWDSKRPITLELLNMLSITKLADTCDKNDSLETICENTLQHQLTMF